MTPGPRHLTAAGGLRAVLATIPGEAPILVPDADGGLAPVLHAVLEEVEGADPGATDPVAAERRAALTADHPELAADVRPPLTLFGGPVEVLVLRTRRHGSQ